MIWRFDSADCRLSEADRQRLIFLHPEQSERLWRELASPTHSHLMQFDPGEIEVIEKKVLDFSAPEDGAAYLSTLIPRGGLCVVFWGATSACIVPTELALTSWDDFFYPSDETTLIALFDSDLRVFSYEETFFFARFHPR
jgi:hypothetical protein